jgi:hypothetical protein
MLPNSEDLPLTKTFTYVTFTYVDQKKKKEAVGLATHVNYSSTANCRAHFLQYFEGHFEIFRGIAI